jgi:hypothetical protein
MLGQREVCSEPLTEAGSACRVDELEARAKEMPKRKSIKRKPHDIESGQGILSGRGIQTDAKPRICAGREAKPRICASREVHLHYQDHD